jgi:acylphosphatase
LVFHGSVQGVGFRWSAARVANSLGVLGYVRNLPGGQVEVLAVGDESRLESLVSILRQRFEVVHVDESLSTSSEQFLAFEIRR